MQCNIQYPNTICSDISQRFKIYINIHQFPNFLSDIIKVGYRPIIVNRQLFILQGVCVLFIPKIGITLFIVFYSFGNVCSLCR